jgi:hypothetical protein
MQPGTWRKPIRRAAGLEASVRTSTGLRQNRHSHASGLGGVDDLSAGLGRALTLAAGSLFSCPTMQLQPRRADSCHGPSVGLGQRLPSRGLAPGLATDPAGAFRAPQVTRDSPGRGSSACKFLGPSRKLRAFLEFRNYLKLESGKPEKPSR